MEDKTARPNACTGPAETPHPGAGGARRLDFYYLDTAFELIDTRSFSNLWFWIALAVAWSASSYWVVGVPFDLVRRAARGDDGALADLVSLSDVQARRLMRMADLSGLALTGLAWFVATALLVLGLVYWIEMAQAAFLIFAPMAVVAWLNLRTARRIGAHAPEALPALMIRHRRLVQGLGIVAVFLTAMWGMWQNLTASVLS